MPREVFTLASPQNGEQLVEIIADTDYSGASVHLFETWRTPADMDAVAALIGRAAQYLRDNGVQ